LLADNDFVVIGVEITSAEENCEDSTALRPNSTFSPTTNTTSSTITYTSRIESIPKWVRVDDDNDD
jgi:hypothetical protein